MNDSLSGFFGRSCDLRQEDPLYPLLFVIVVEALSKMFSIIVNGVFFQVFPWGL